MTFTAPTASAGIFQCDVLVVGGRPAGSTIAAMRPERGHEEAMISLLAGDVFCKTPIRASLLARKAMYHAVPVAFPGRTVRAWLRRRTSLRDVEVPAS